MESTENLVMQNLDLSPSGCLTQNIPAASGLPGDIYWDDIKTFHPALDFKGDTAFIAVNLDFKQAEQKQGMTVENIVPEVFVVDSDRHLYSITDERAFAAKGLRLAKNITMVPYRWKKRRLKEFLEGKSTVNIGRLFEDIKECFKRYIRFEEQDTYAFIALWVIGTYLHPLFDAFPMVLLCGPKSSGKSRTLQVTSLLAFNARLQGDPTPATLFRTIDEERPTMLFDEMEWLSHKDVNNQMATILKFGYKPGCKVPRCAFDKFNNPYPIEFDAYCPKMFANINGLENVLGDRTVTFYQKRKTDDDAGIEKRNPLKDDSIWQEIRHTLYVFTLTHWARIKEILNEGADIPLQNRDWELFSGILALARFFEESGGKTGLYQEILDMAMRKAEERKAEDIDFNHETIVIQALMSLVKEDEWYPLPDIMKEIKKFFSSDAKWINDIWTGRTLGRLGIAKAPHMKKRKWIRDEFGNPKNPTHYFITRSEVESLALRFNAEQIEPEKLTDEEIQVIKSW